MEQHLTNDEKAKVFALYWGSNAQIFGDLSQTEDFDFKYIDMDYDNFEYCVSEPLRIVLIHLSDITDEHAVEYAKMFWHAPQPADWLLVGKNLLWNKLGDWSYKEHQYLISKGYAVPLFFGMGHWANGKTAIELGIAIEKYKNDGYDCAPIDLTKINDEPKQWAE